MLKLFSNDAENIFVIWVDHITATETVFPGHALIIYTQYCWVIHYNDAIMGAIASQITSLTIVYSTVYSDADQRKHQSSGSLPFVWGIHQWPLNSPAQMASNMENVFIWWRHHVYKRMCSGLILGLCPANEWCRYKVTPSILGWVQI